MKPVVSASSQKNWENDSIQFPRLLDELQGIGVLDLMKEAEWSALEASMDLSREQIMELFGRAQAVWDKIKAKTVAVSHRCKPGVCCSCGYKGKRETPCPTREDGTHCEHWWDGGLE